MHRDRILTRPLFRSSLCYSFKMRKAQKLFLKTAYPFLRVYWFLLRPKTTGVRCLITHGDNILLIQHSYGSSRWSVPGGGVKSSESLEEAVKREVFEEVGIRTSVVKKQGQVFYDAEYKKDTIWVFQTEVISYEYQIDDIEIINAQWFPLNKLPNESSHLLRQFLTLHQSEQSSHSSR